MRLDMEQAGYDYTLNDLTVTQGGTVNSNVYYHSSSMDIYEVRVEFRTKGTEHRAGGTLIRFNGTSFHSMIAFEGS